MQSLGAVVQSQYISVQGGRCFTCPGRQHLNQIHYSEETPECLKYFSSRQGTELRLLLVWEFDFSSCQVTMCLSPLALLLALKRTMATWSPCCWLMLSFWPGKTIPKLSSVLWLKVGYRRTCSFLHWSQRQQTCWTFWNAYPRPCVGSVGPRVHLLSCSVSVQAPQLLLTSCEGNMLMEVFQQ